MSAAAPRSGPSASLAKVRGLVSSSTNGSRTRPPTWVEPVTEVSPRLEYSRQLRPFGWTTRGSRLHAETCPSPGQPKRVKIDRDGRAQSARLRKTAFYAVADPEEEAPPRELVHGRDAGQRGERRRVAKNAAVERRDPRGEPRRRDELTLAIERIRRIFYFADLDGVCEVSGVRGDACDGVHGAGFANLVEAWRGRGHGPPRRGWWRPRPAFGRNFSVSRLRTRLRRRPWTNAGRDGAAARPPAGKCVAQARSAPSAASRTAPPQRSSIQAPRATAAARVALSAAASNANAEARGPVPIASVASQSAARRTSASP